jgi:hypothetical protein
MAFIKGVLKEELENSQKLKDFYENKLKSLPAGSLSGLKRRGKKYYYLKFREGKKVKNVYKGILCSEEIQKYGEISKNRKKYRHSLSLVKKQIKYLKGALRGKEPV